MKLFVASDVHGSSYYAKMMVDRFEEENAEKLIILGDIYNHGPRNPLPKDYNPGEVASILNGIKDKLLVVKGNCDSEVDKMISEFHFIEELSIFIGDKTILLTHGHVYNKNSMPLTKFDALIYGHLHTGFIEKNDDGVFVNVGSVSLPKNNTPNSYLIIENNRLILKKLDGEKIKEISL